MWHAEIEQINGRTYHYRILSGETQLDFAAVVSAWQSDDQFRKFFTQLLAESPFDAYRWETPPVTEETRVRAFEFVLLRSDELQRPADYQPFADHFSGESIVTFANLGQDAVLVVPCPAATAKEPTDDVAFYSHLASFVRQAPTTQVDGLWQAVGAAMQQRAGAKPVWLSTAGMGVSWLHVRLDDRPKYYGHGPFRQMRKNANESTSRF